MFAELSRALHAHDDLDGALRAVVHTARAAVGSAHAGVVLRRGDGTLVSTALTGDLVRACDQAQFDTGQGPCLDAIDTGPVLRIADMRSESRWPRFTRRAVRLGVGSMLACRLTARRGVKASLNLHAPRPYAFDDDATRLAEIFALHASVALTGVRLRETLEQALASRQRIGEATGLVMGRFDVDPDQAFRILVRVSQHHNVKLRDLAARVVGEGPGILPPYADADRPDRSP
ncbi:GAF and ANTAR domain-containing protein [Streptomyces capparidis]